MDTFDEKVSVITGTANPRGIGFATARLLGQLGSAVVLADLNGAEIEQRCAELAADGIDALAVETDMSDPDSVVALSDVAFDRFGAVHVLLLNHVAPTGGPGHGLLSPDPSSWVLHTNVNLLGCVYGIKAFVPRIIDQGHHAHVLATVSGAGATGVMYGNGPYATTKAAITTLMECLHGQLRDVGADIVAGVVFPPVTDTFPAPGLGEMTIDLLRSTGVPVALNSADDVASFTVDALRSDSFWAHPTLEQDAYATGGLNREAILWENEIYAARARALQDRSAPDPYLWGPPASVLGAP